MGYTFELRAVPPGALYRELAQPTIDRSDVDFESYGAAALALRAQWPEAAAAVSRAVADGGGALSGLLALYVHQVLRTVGVFLGSLDHSSSGGEDFRRRFLPGPAVRLLGVGTVGRLVNREIAGFNWTDYPSFGWASAAELAPALETSAGVNLDQIADEPDDEDALLVLGSAARRAVQLGADLVTAYG